MSAQDAHPASPGPSSSDPSARLAELLVDRATDGLRTEEWRELGGLLDANPEASVDDYELAAAWLEVEQLKSELRHSHGGESNGGQGAEVEFEPLPAHLCDRIVVEGRLLVRNHRATLPRRPESRPDESSFSNVTPMRSPASLGWLGYAATALFGLTLGFLLTSNGPRELAAEDAYAALLERRAPSDLVRATWVAVDGSGAELVRGEVVWCDIDQEGYMRLEGLTPNEITREQYQLWIVDEDRGHKEPVDGGVFDIAAKDGVQTVPIDSALVVDQPGLFVITLEPKGGVVVSDGPFLATAKVDG